MKELMAILNLESYYNFNKSTCGGWFPNNKIEKDLEKVFLKMKEGETFFINLKKNKDIDQISFKKKGEILEITFEGKGQNSIRYSSFCFKAGTLCPMNPFNCNNNCGISNKIEMGDLAQFIVKNTILNPNRFKNEKPLFEILKIYRQIDGEFNAQSMSDWILEDKLERGLD